MPPVTRLAPRVRKPSASDWAFSTMPPRVVLERGSFRLRERDRLRGHHVRERAAEHHGAALVDASAYSSCASTMPPRGPRSVLCVVVVVMCACGPGHLAGEHLARDDPAKWAMSTMNMAPTSSAISRIFAKFILRG